MAIAKSQKNTSNYCCKILHTPNNYHLCRILSYYNMHQLECIRTLYLLFLGPLGLEIATSK